jgi:hypothetical protein
VRLQFGKYRGLDLEDVPLGYLGWLLEEGKIDAPLRRAVRSEIGNRIGSPLDGRSAAPRALPLTPEVAATADDLIALGYRQLALRHHPDRGGDHHLMIAATSARDWLTSVLEASA